MLINYTETRQTEFGGGTGNLTETIITLRANAKENMLNVELGTDYPAKGLTNNVLFALYKM